MVVTVVNVIITFTVCEIHICAGTGADCTNISQKAGYKQWKRLKMHLKHSLANASTDQMESDKRPL